MKKHLTQLLILEVPILKNIGEYYVEKSKIESRIKEAFKDEYADTILNNLSNTITLPKEIAIVNDDGTGDLILIASRRDPMYVPGEEKLQVSKLIDNTSVYTKYKYIILVDTAQENVYIRVYNMNPEEAVHYVETAIFDKETNRINSFALSYIVATKNATTFNINLTLSDCKCLIKLLKKRKDISSNAELMERLRICKMKLLDMCIY